MEDEISKQNNNINKIKSEFENKVINLRQNIDDLYQKKVEHDKLLKKNKKMNNDNNNDDVNEGIIQNENAKIQDLKNRIIELQKQQERHKIISMKQINDCKSKLNGWIKYSQQCKQMNEMLKSQLKQYAQIYRNNNNNRSNNNSNKISSIDQVYVCISLLYFIIFHYISLYFIIFYSHNMYNIYYLATRNIITERNTTMNGNYIMYY